MTQFMLVKSGTGIDAPSGISLQPFGEADDFLCSVARFYFGSIDDCRLVVDPHGVTEPLVDELWEAQRSGEDLGRGALFQLVSDLVQHGVEFVLWSGGDFGDLPIVRTMHEVEDQLRSQTRAQPADVILHFCPSADR